ncbi:MAG: YdcF family protein [Eubacteriales bacterium]
MKGTIIRNIAGSLLILSVLPPWSVGVINVFVLLPAFFGLILLFLPLIRKCFHQFSAKTQSRIILLLKSMVIIAALIITAELILIRANIPMSNAPARSVVIVLGAQVVKSRPTLILAGRIEAAANYMAAHPDSVCIASGGRGADEDISEAKCIRDTLVLDYHIDAERIYMDDSSYNTSQNLENSAKIIFAHDLSTNVLIATDGFHMFRAKTLAGWKGLTPYSCPASTDRRLVFYLYIRELFGIPKTLLFDR